MADFEFRVTNRVGTAVFNRPAKRNSFTVAMVDAWRQVLLETARDPDVGALVLTGSGGHFCAGVDLDTFTEVARRPVALWQLLTDHMHQVAAAVEDYPKPIIAAMQGSAVGAGMDIGLMCDMRFVGESVRLTEGYIRLGLVPGEGGCYYLPRLVGPAKALELLLSGDTVDAAEAHRIGLANRVFPDDELLAATQAFAEKLVEAAPLTVEFIRKTVYQSARMDLRSSLAMTASHSAVAYSTPEATAIIDAVERRRTAATRPETTGANGTAVAVSSAEKG